VAANAKNGETARRLRVWLAVAVTVCVIAAIAVGALKAGLSTKVEANKTDIAEHDVWISGHETECAEIRGNMREYSTKQEIVMDNQGHPAREDGYDGAGASVDERKAGCDP